MIYAPVIIATLNRYDHLKRCLESLERNEWAKYTEVFISVDYPVKTEWFVGYNYIVEYIKKSQWSFKKTNIFIQEKNLGAPENFKFLREKVFEKYDRLIQLDDDLETSENFLEYMNKALEHGEKDESIFCVCGYSRKVPSADKRKCTIYKNVGASWGLGIYRKKYRKMENDISFQWLDKVVYNVRSMNKVFRKRRQPTFYLLFTDYIMKYNPVFQYKDGSIRPIDVLLETYMIMNDMYAIYPITSKIRNWGYDGTGQNCSIRRDMEPQCQVLDNSRLFELIEPANEEESRKIVREIERKTGERYDKREVIKAWLYYLYCKLRKRIGKQLE